MRLNPHLPKTFVPTADDMLTLRAPSSGIGIKKKLFKELNDVP